MTRELGLRCEESPDTTVHACLDRLRRRRVELADALGGRSLRVALAVGSPAHSANYNITFTRDGHVMSRSGPDFRPHLEIHGAPGAVARFVAGDTTMMEASFDGLVTLHVPTIEAAAFRRLRALVAEEFRADSGDSRPKEVAAKPGGS